MSSDDKSTVTQHTDDQPGQNLDPDFFSNVKSEFSDTRMWFDRAVVLTYAVLAGLCVVGFTILSDWMFTQFQVINSWNRWIVLIWTPALTASIVWITRKWFPTAGGSGIPQVIAALDPTLPAERKNFFTSVKLSLAKVGLAATGFLAGLSIGREGPSVQVAAGIMQNARVWLRPNSTISGHALLVAGGAAGIAAAFNAPLAGVVFAIEELSRKLESRNSGLIIAAIVLSGLMAVSAFGNLAYFGVIRAPILGWRSVLPGLLVIVVSGLLGGLFSRVMVISLTGLSSNRFSEWRRKYPIRFAAAGGLVIAIIGIVSGGTTYGAGSEPVRQMIEGNENIPPLFALLKFMTTWITAWTGVPGGIFAPSLSIGAGIGHDVASLMGFTGSLGIRPALIAVGMTAFLAAVTQAPLTSFIIVMEMVDGHSMVLSLMAAAMVASLISRTISRPLYSVLAVQMVANLRPTR